MSEAEAEGAPQRHRTIDRVTEILEAVVYKPGITFAELARVVDAPKSSIHGFVRGLLATGWLYQAERGFYLGPAIYGLTLVSGRVQAGQVSQAELDALHEETGLAVFLGVEAGNHLIYVGESGTQALTGFAARSNIRRKLISTAGGKALLVERGVHDRESYLRSVIEDDPDSVAAFVAEYSDIVNSGVASNLTHHGAQLALSAVVRNQAGDPVGAIVIVGATDNMRKREAKLRKILQRYASAWSEGKSAAL